MRRNLELQRKNFLKLCERVSRNTTVGTTYNVLSLPKEERRKSWRNFDTLIKGCALVERLTK